MIHVAYIKIQGHEIAGYAHEIHDKRQGGEGSYD